MRAFTLALIASVSVSAFGAPPRKFCLPSLPGPLPPVTFLQSVNIETPVAAVRLNKAMKEQRLLFRAKNDSPEVQFIPLDLQGGDCMLLNLDETLRLKVAEDDRVAAKRDESLLDTLGRWRSELWGRYRHPTEKDLVPAVLHRASDGAKHFGLIERSGLRRLAEDLRHLETPTNSILRHVGKHNDLLAVYILCPRERQQPCRLRVKRDGAWVADPATLLPFELSVLARSRREGSDGLVSYRIAVGGDTPQGIYYLWATMFTKDPVYGGVPRLVLDTATPPPNAFAYGINSYVLSELVPEASLGDYWANEGALAFRLGRVSLRIHGSEGASSRQPASLAASSLRPTDGCISAGIDMLPLLNRLAAVGAVGKEALAETTPDPATLGWRVSPALGRAFVIVKDVD